MPSPRCARFGGDRAEVFPRQADTDHNKRLAETFRLILRTAKVPPSRLRNGLFHKLRRTTITHTAVRAGLAAAIALAGHSGPYVTDRYIDPTFLIGNDATEWLPSVTDLARRDLPPRLDQQEGGPDRGA